MAVCYCVASPTAVMHFVLLNLGQNVSTRVRPSFQWTFGTWKSRFLGSLQVKQLQYCSGFPPFSFGEYMNLNAFQQEVQKSLPPSLCKTPAGYCFTAGTPALKDRLVNHCTKGTSIECMGIPTFFVTLFWKFALSKFSKLCWSMKLIPLLERSPPSSMPGLITSIANAANECHNGVASNDNK
ncbi:UNVERIFIED_CONTAM: hypothetical protein FKN15_035419 [Acipenser sinensis]